MLRLSITGGIASGKTTACEYLEKTYGAYIFNADKESKAYLKSSIILQRKITNIFGNDILENKKINFQLLADKVFSNDMNHKIINGIMWPEVYVLIEKSYKKIYKKRKHKLFIVDAALIFEAKFDHFFDSNLLITANKDTRIERAIKRTNMPLENIQNRISKQLSDKKKKSLADHTITNNKNLNSFYTDLDYFYKNILFK